MTRRTIAAGTLADLRALLAQANTLADTLRAALSAADSEPKPTAPPWVIHASGAIRADVDGRVFARVSALGYWESRFSARSGRPNASDLAPSVSHAMAAADADLADHMTVSDPAPEPPDLSGVEFGGWSEEDSGLVEHRPILSDGLSCAMLEDGLQVCGRRYPSITTREAADAFLLACGATLAEASDVICEQCSARTAQVKRGACPEIECPHGLSIAGAKRAKWSGQDLLGRTALGVERIGLVRPSYGSGLWLAIYRGKTQALPGTEKAARAAVEAAARADGWEIV